MTYRSVELNCEVTTCGDK